MLERHARYVPVMDGTTLQGVVSFHDVAKAVYEEQSFENRMLKSYIKDWPDEDETRSRPPTAQVRAAPPALTPAAGKSPAACRSARGPRRAIAPPFGARSSRCRASGRRRRTRALRGFSARASAPSIATLR